MEIWRVRLSQLPTKLKLKLKLSLAMMRELKTLQRVHDVEETEIGVERLKKLVEELEEDVEEVKKKNS